MKAILAVSLAVFGLFAFVSAQAPKSQWDGIYTAAQAKRGSGIYADKCSSCHGDNLTGGDNAPGLVGGEFSANWNDLRIGDLFERIRISMPQDAPGSLSRQEYADVLAYTLQKGNYPAGDAELPTQLDALNAIQFIATKP
jgi:mono/diheme cytochrome c family protein